MAEPVSLQTLLTYLTLISVPVGVFYHIMTLRNTRKNQQLQLETRQVQLYMQLLDRFTSEENNLKRIRINQLEFEDFEDFIRKYGMEADPETSASRFRVLTELSGIGHLLHRGLIEIEFIPQVIMEVTKNFWEKWGPIELEMRRYSNNPRRSEYVEYLYKEVTKYREEHPELQI